MHRPDPSRVGSLDDALGAIRHVSCDSCRTIVVDAHDECARRSWRIRYPGPAILALPPNCGFLRP